MSKKRWRTTDYGKIIDETSFLIDGKNYPVELRMKRKNSIEPYEYTAVFPDEDRDVCAFGDDANKVLADLKSKIYEELGIVWTNHIHICVSSGDTNLYDFQGRCLDLGLNLIQVGTYPDGSTCHRDAEIDDDGNWFSHSRIMHGSGRIGDQTDIGSEHFGLIPYSEMAWNQLKKILDTIDGVRERVIDLITGEDKDKIIENITKVKALMGIKEKK